MVQGIALYRSMTTHMPTFRLWVLCLDEETFQALGKLSLPNLCPLRLAELETAELLKIKGKRSLKEYCWTLTPFAPRFVFELEPEIERITYVDADLYFTKSPNLIFSEFEKSSKSVLITEHAYDPQHDQTLSSGKYCVQFITFDRMLGEKVRKDWELKCIDWCYSRHEDGKFGDQKYLEAWPVDFSELVYVLENKELIRGPWNANFYPNESCIAWHFHDFRLFALFNYLGAFIGDYPLPEQVIKKFYVQYFKESLNIIKYLDESKVIYLLQNKFLKGRIFSLAINFIQVKLKRRVDKFLFQGHLPAE